MSIIAMMPYILGAEACILGVVGFWLLWHFKLRTVYRADLFERLDDTAFGRQQYMKVGQKEFKRGETTANHKIHGAFTIHYDKQTYRDGHKNIWCFDVSNKQGITFGGSHTITNPKYAQSILYNGVLSRFTKLLGALDTTMFLIIALLLGVAVICFALGIFASPYVLPAQSVVNATASVPTPVV